MGLFGSVAGIFSAVQQQRAAGEAQKILNVNRVQMLQQAGGFEQMAKPYFGAAAGSMDEATGYGDAAQVYADAFNPLSPNQIETATYEPLLQEIIRQTQGMTPGEGLSPADQIALQDAQRIVNENMSATGNLRSGAAGFASAELARRVVADASTRNFNNRATQLGLLSQLSHQGTTSRLARNEQLSSVANTLNNLRLAQAQLRSGTAMGRAGLAMNKASLNMNTGLSKLGMASNLMGAAAGMAPQLASAELNKGAASANMIGAAGGLGDSLLNMGMGAFLGAGGMGTMGGATGWAGAAQGAISGPSNLMQMAMMQKMMSGMGY